LNFGNDTDKLIVKFRNKKNQAENQVKKVQKQVFNYQLGRNLEINEMNSIRQSYGDNFDKKLRNSKRK
jgi:hypothetical protein